MNDKSKGIMCVWLVQERLHLVNKKAKEPNKIGTH